MSGKYSPGVLVIRQKLLDNAKQSAADVLTTSSKDNSKNSNSIW